METESCPRDAFPKGFANFGNEKKAALLRDQIAELKAGTGVSKIEPKRQPVKYGKGRKTKARA